jgi:hypothetical protein
MLPDPARFGFAQLNDPPHPLRLHRACRHSAKSQRYRAASFPKTPPKEAVDAA